ncbi:MAG TPA: CBS domain-containing protein [Sediminibacterium sp.]|nr:CBS domain-containing protein [Sediminibacterium sp.]
MRKVSDILSRKGNRVAMVSPETNVIEALQLMAEQNIGSLVVVSNSQFVGILTERDYSRKVVLKGRNSSDTSVAEIMTTDFPPVTPGDTVEKCMQLMSLHHIRYLPVIVEDELVGIVSMNDVVTETILNQEETISQLQIYIQS